MDILLCDICQVVDSTIELTEKQHSTGSVPHSTEDRSEDDNQHHHAEASFQHRVDQMIPDHDAA